MKAIRNVLALRAPAAALVLGLLAGVAGAQDEGGEQDGGELLPPIGLGSHDSSSEIPELFAEVERKQREIDVLLSDAGAGDIPLDAPEDSGIAELLRRTQQSGSQVLETIDKILESGGT